MAAQRFRRKPEYVTAEEWRPGVRPDIVYTDPKKLVGLWWAHMGHQRELDGSCGIVLVGGNPCFVHPGGFIVTHPDGGISVHSAAHFEALYEPDPEPTRTPALEAEQAGEGTDG